MKKGHAGWSNHETWLVALWLENDQKNYQRTNELVRKVIAHHGEIEYDGGTLSHNLKHLVESMVEESGAEGFILHLVNAALSEVDWFELATSYILSTK